MKTFKDVESYINSFPKPVQAILEKIRKVVKKSAPKAKEGISYGMPEYKQEGPVLYFAAFKHHIGFYPTPSGISAFKKYLSKYKSSKGAVQFPIDKPIPLAIIEKMVKFKVKENVKGSNEFPKMSVPATRALVNAKIKTLKDLSKWTEVAISKLHGMGPSTIPKLKSALKLKGLTFKK